jgi:hypothetical protein
MAASKYVVYIEPAEEGGYIVSCPDFPGCVTQGETMEEGAGYDQRRHQWLHIHFEET